MKPIGACIFLVSFLMIFASLVRFDVFVMPLGGSKVLVVDVSIGPYQWLGRSPSHHEVLTPVQLLLRLQNHHHHTQAATTTTTTPQTSLAMDQEEKKQVQSIRDQLKGHSLPDGGEIVKSINSSSSEFNATNNRAHIVRQYESGSTASERKTTRGTPDRKWITFSLFSLEDLRQYFVRKLIKAVSVCILLAIYIFCSKVSLHLRVRSSTQPSASQQVEIVERTLLSLSDDFDATIDNSPYEPIRYPCFLRFDARNRTIPAALEKPKEPEKKKKEPGKKEEKKADPKKEPTIPPVPALVPHQSEEIRIPPPAPPPKAPEKPRRGQTKGKVLENLRQCFGRKRADDATIDNSPYEPIRYPPCFLHFDARNEPEEKKKKEDPGKKEGKKDDKKDDKKQAQEKPIPPRAPESKKNDPRDIRSVNLQQHFGQPRADVAASYGVSISTFKRVCREQGIDRWRDRMGSRVSKSPDQHGERNTSIARETPSHNVQTGMEGELFGQNEVANVFRRDFMGGPIALNTFTACETPSQNVQTGMEGEPIGQNQEANEFRRDSMEHSIAWNTENDSAIAARGSLQSTTYPYRNDLVFSQPQIASIEVPNENMEGHVTGFGNWTVGSCSDLAPSQPMHTFSHATGSSENMIWLASVEKDLMVGNVCGSSMSDPALSENLKRFEASMEKLLMEGNVYGSSMPDPALSQPTVRQDRRSVKIKATFEDTNIKFQFPHTSGIKELGEVMLQIQECKLGSFKVEYNDEVGKWILMAPNEHVGEYLQLLTSLGYKVTIEQKVQEKVHTTNFCDNYICNNCRSLKRKSP